MLRGVVKAVIDRESAGRDFKGGKSPHLRYRVGQIGEAAGVYAGRKIEELAERKLRFDHPELAQPENE